MLASLPLGFCFGTIQVVLPAFSDADGRHELAGVLIAIWAASSAAAGLLYGARPPRAASLRGVHVRFALLLPLGCAALLARRARRSRMALLVPLAGAPIAPLVASRNELVERLAPRGTTTEAFTWPLTALVAGVVARAQPSPARSARPHSWTRGRGRWRWASPTAGARSVVLARRARSPRRRPPERALRLWTTWVDAAMSCSARFSSSQSGQK